MPWVQWTSSDHHGALRGAAHRIFGADQKAMLTLSDGVQMPHRGYPAIEILPIQQTTSEENPQVAGALPREDDQQPTPKYRVLPFSTSSICTCHHSGLRNAPAGESLRHLSRACPPRS